MEKQNVPYLTDTEITEEKYKQFKEAICVGMENYKCESEFMLQFVGKLSAAYDFKQKDLYAFCNANRVECTVHRKVEDQARTLHNESIEAEAESEGLNGWAMLSAMLSGGAQAFSQTAPKAPAKTTTCNTDKGINGSLRTVCN